MALEGHEQANLSLGPLAFFVRLAFAFVPVAVVGSSSSCLSDLHSSVAPHELTRAVARHTAIDYPLDLMKRASHRLLRTGTPLLVDSCDEDKSECRRQSKP